MKEIYKSFEGVLNVEHQSGFIVSTSNSGGIIIECLDVHTDIPDSKYSVSAGNKDFNADTDWSKYESVRDLFLALAECNDVKTYDNKLKKFVKEW